MRTPHSYASNSSFLRYTVHGICVNGRRYALCGRHHHHHYSCCDRPTRMPFLQNAMYVSALLCSMFACADGIHDCQCTCILLCTYVMCVCVCDACIDGVSARVCSDADHSSRLRYRFFLFFHFSSILSICKCKSLLHINFVCSYTCTRAGVRELYPQNPSYFFVFSSHLFYCSKWRCCVAPFISLTIICVVRV